MHAPQYEIEGTVNLDSDPCWLDPTTCPTFQQRYRELQGLLVDAVERGDSRTIYKFGYGDYLFLTQQSVGSARVGLRALRKPYASIEHASFVDGASLCDHYACAVYPEHIARFGEVISRRIDFPAELVSALVASRWLFQRFRGAIGLIGADTKLRLIRGLMDAPEYRAYLGIERFEDYVCIPQRFACDDARGTEREVARQLERSRSRIFLVGIGHVKSGLLHRMKQHANAVFLDVGQGIDALAGIIDTERPFFGGWVNHRTPDASLYEDIDYLTCLPYAFLNSV